MINVLLVDDHTIVREGLKRIINETNGMKVISEAENGQKAMELIWAEKPFDIVVLDISLPGKNGLEVLKEIKNHNPELPVLMLSMHAEDQYAIRALKAGAAGYMTKESASLTLVDSIRKVKNGGKIISDELAELLATNLTNKKAGQPHKQLSDREFQVLVLFAEGQTVIQISQSLNLSDKTISTYRTRILQKMQMKTNAELIRYGISNNLVK